MILWGDEETVFPQTEQDALVSKIPHSTLKVYPETGNSPHWEKPAQFVTVFQTFLNEKHEIKNGLDK